MHTRQSYSIWLAFVHTKNDKENLAPKFRSAFKEKFRVIVSQSCRIDQHEYIAASWENGPSDIMQTAKLQASVWIRAVSPEPLLFDLNYIKVYCLRKQIAKLLARLGGCAGSPEALLFAYVGRSIFSRRSLLSNWPGWKCMPTVSAIFYSALSNFMLNKTQTRQSYSLFWAFIDGEYDQEEVRSNILFCIQRKSGANACYNCFMSRHESFWMFCFL